MLHRVRRSEIEQRRVAGGDPRNDRVDAWRRFVREEHRTGLRPQRKHVTRPIVLLVPPRALVLLDYIVVVLVHRVGGRHARLHVRVHAEPVHIEACLAFEHERRARLQPGEVLGRLYVHRLAVWVRTGWQIDLGTRDAQKAQRITVRERGGFFRIDDIVRNGGNTSG